MTDLSIIIVNYNSTSYLEKCLKSIRSADVDFEIRVTVVDNNSNEDHPSRLKPVFPEVEWVFNEANRGFAAACNQGLSQTPGHLYLLLNPDCVLEQETLSRCHDFLGDHPKIGILGCQVVNPDGTLQRACRRRIPTPSVALGRIVGLHRLFPGSSFAAYNYGEKDPAESHPVEAVSGAFLLFRQEVLQDVEGLDERFFLYGEDLDFCYRASQAGWLIYYYADARATHFKRQSSSTNVEASTFHFYDAMEIFYRKHFAPDATWLSKTAITTAIRVLYGVKRLQQRVLGVHSVGSKG